MNKVIKKKQMKF